MDAPRCGAPARATRSYREQLLAFSLWTGDRLPDYLAERTSVRLSRASIYRLLRAGGVHLNRPQHTITSPDPEYAVKKRRWSAPVIT